jgi:hypothetical protein
LLNKWLAHYDTIHRGWTPRGIAAGVCATNGFAFPRVSGGYNLYRRIVAQGIDSAVGPVGAAGAGATSIGNFPWRPHAADTVYAYSVRSVGGGGVESAASSPERIVVVDEGGVAVGPRPNSPVMVTVSPAAGGRFWVRWVYAKRFEEAAPATFEVLHFPRPGVVDPEAPEPALVPYVRGKSVYGYLSDGFGHGVERRWRVRAISGEGVDDRNDALVPGFADAAAPAGSEVTGVCLEDVDA